MLPNLISLPNSTVRCRSWSSPRPQAVFLLIHGLGAHSARWEGMADFFTTKGIALVAPELRGFGENPEPRGHVDSFALYEQDFDRLLQTIAQNDPGKPVIIVGESMGGLLGFNYCARHPHAAAGLVLISPGFKNAMVFRLGDYFTTFTSLLYNPRKRICLPFTAAMCTRDLAYQKRMDEDPRELRVASSKLLINILAEQLQAPRLAKAMTVPCLFLLAGQDFLVDPGASNKVFQRVAGRDKHLIQYPDMRHALSIDLGKEKVFADIDAWLRPRFAA